MLSKLLRKDTETPVYIRELSTEEAKAYLSTYFVSAVGHQGTAEFLTKLLGIQVPVSRRQIELTLGDRLIVVQPWDVRLNPGQELTADVMMELYKQGKVKFIMVEIP
jgi:hypothetical protein